MLDDGGAPAPTPVSPDILEATKKVVNMLSMEGLVVEKVDLKYIKLGFLIWCAYLSKVEDQRISNLMKGGMKSEEGDALYNEVWKWLSGKSDHTFPILLNACAQDYLSPLAGKPLDFLIKCGDKLKQDMLDILHPGPAVFLYPTFPHVAAHHGQLLANPFNTSYSVTFNAIGLPSTQVPLGLNSDKIPYGFQIVTAPFNDRLSIALAEYLEKKLGGWVEPS